MSMLASKFRELFLPFRPRTPVSQLQASGDDESATEDEQAETQDCDTQEIVDEAKPKKLCARERLKRLSRFRIRSRALKFDSSGSGKCGGKGEVVQATFRPRIWNRRQVVAVKKLIYYEEINRKKFHNEFAHEVEVLAGLSHENIVRLIGFAENFEKGKAWIVMSWEPNGNVSEFLAAGKWEIPERISLIQDTFEGLKYLHTRQPPICHGDLKSLNILVSLSSRAIITDFGSARFVRESADGGTAQGSGQGPNRNSKSKEDLPQISLNATGNQLTLTGPAWSLRWAPPEAVNGNRRPGLPGDVWSAGWVCWEIMTDKLPFPDLDSGCAITMEVMEGRVPSASEDERLSQIVRLCSLMTTCWAFDPEERPGVSQCCDEVKWMPSIPPLGGERLDSAARTSKLVLQMGRMHYLQARYDNAAPLFKRVLETATHEEDRIVRAGAFYWLGKVFAAQSQYVEAEESYSQAQDTYASLGDGLGQANSLEGLGDIYHLQSKLAEAEESFTHAKAIYDRLGNNQGQANTLCGLAHIHRARSNYAQAEESFISARKIYTRIGDASGRAKTLQALGSVYHSQSKYAEAEDSYNQAESTYNRIGDDQGRANTLLDLGDVYRGQLKYAEAVSSYTLAEEIYTRIGINQGQAKASYGLGEVYRDILKYAEAEESYSKAQSTYNYIGDDQGRANTLLRLGDVYRRQSKHAEVVSSYTLAEKIYTRIGINQGQANASYGLGECYRDIFKYAEAEDSFNKAESAYNRIGDDQARANTLLGLGDVYRRQSKHAEAVSSYTLAEEIYTRIGINQGQANASHGLGEVYRDIFKYDGAASRQLQSINPRR